MATLGIVHSTALPMREISALAVRPGKSGSELLAVGDEDFAVICAELDDDGRPAETSRHDLHRVLGDEIPDGESGSGFEGIATDGAGNVIVLQEELSRLLVLSPGVDRLLGTWRVEPCDERHRGRA